jgi:hypothetical protein
MLHRIVTCEIKWEANISEGVAGMYLDALPADPSESYMMVHGS